MEPGSEDPGYPGRLLVTIDNALASMEPGSEDPGYRTAAHFRHSQRRCFNGAGVRRPRIPVCECFSPLSSAGLQWSRGPKTPDTIHHRRIGLLVKDASMEPGSEDPGYDFYAFDEATEFTLQWSRGPKTPDTSVLQAQTTRQPTGFNGAGVRRPRILKYAGPAAHRGKQLQWSRGPKTPDTCRWNRLGNLSNSGFNGAGVRRPRIHGHRTRRGKEQ